MHAKMRGMTNPSTASAANQFDFRSFKEKLAKYLRAEDFAGAEAFLSTYSEQVHPRLSAICRSLRSEDVSTSGWERICAEIAKIAGGDAITALGFDLTEHADGAADQEGRIEPGIETSYYSDQYFPFSCSDSRAVNDQIAADANPWQGCFEEIDHSLQVRGLARLLAEVHALQEGEGRGREFDAWVGLGYLALRFHQSVVRDARQFGLPRPMYIVIGEHDFLGLYIDAAYRIEETADHSAKVDAIVAADRAEAERVQLAQAKEFIDELRERREHVRGWSIFNNPMKRRVFVDYCKSREALLFGSSSLPSLPDGRNTWKLDDARFETFLLEVWRARGFGPETFPGVVNEASGVSGGSRRRTFGRKAG